MKGGFWEWFRVKVLRRLARGLFFWDTFDGRYGNFGYTQPPSGSSVEFEVEEDFQPTKHWKVELKEKD